MAHSRYPLKVGDDWTGYFIRGDEALGWLSPVFSRMADYFDGKLDVPDDVKKAWAAELRDISEDMKRCNECRKELSNG